MAEIKAVHECLFCPQTFDTASAKDDHILEHFAQETCVECNRNLIRIGGSLYTKHDGSTCIKWTVKIEECIEPHSAETHHLQHIIAGAPTSDTAHVQVKIEQQQMNTFDDDDGSSELSEQHQDFPYDLHEKSNASAVFESLDDGFDSQKTIFESEMDTIKSNDASEFDEQTEKNDFDSGICKSYDNYPCDLCNSSYRTDATYRQHMRRKHDQIVETFKCNLCRSSFSKECLLNEHLLDEHQCTAKLYENLNIKFAKKGEFECKICKKDFVYKQSLQRHQLRMHPPKLTEYIHQVDFANNFGEANENNDNEKFKCIKCSVTFPNANLLQSHDCPSKDCNKRFSGPAAFRLHQVRFHSPKDTIFCKICGHSFSTIDERDKHKIECTIKRRKSQQKLHGRFECDICKTRIKTKASLRRHMLAKHNPNVDKFKCKTCGAIFLKEATHQHHLCRGKRQNIEQKELIACETCGKMLSRGALNTHRTIFHSRAFYCRTCFRIFPNADSLNTHSGQCGVKKKLGRKLPCNVCGKVMASFKSLARHKISFHTEGIIFCKTCVKKFKTAEELHAHIPECSLRRKMKRRKTKKLGIS